MRVFSVKNFDKFQHYKDRSPPWIKLYNELLDDYDFGQLPDASKWHLVAIWLLASRSNNKIPFDSGWVSRRINANSAVDLDGLAKSGFIIVNQELHNAEQDASKPLATCSSKWEPETEIEGEAERELEQKESRPLARDESVSSKKKTRKEFYNRPYSKEFERFWSAYPVRAGTRGKKEAWRSFQRLIDNGVDAEVIIRTAGVYAEEERKLRHINTPYIKQAATWLNQYCWEDYSDKSGTAADTTFPVFEGTEQWNAWVEAGHNPSLKTDIRDPTTGRRRDGWKFKTEWPPDVKVAA